jgi:BRCA1 C Terminus (BRCT) domain
MDDIIIDVTGQRVVLTGKGPAPRNILVAMLKQYGAIVQPSVRKDTTLLIVENPSKNTRKLDKARAAGVAIRNYGEVFDMEERDPSDPATKVRSSVFRDFVARHGEEYGVVPDERDGLIYGIFYKELPRDVMSELESNLESPVSE